MILDAAIVVIILAFVIIGARAGLTRMVLRAGALILSILLAWLLYPIVSKLLEGFMLESVSNAIKQSYIMPHLDSIVGGADILPAFLRDAATGAADSAAQAMSDSAAVLIINTTAFLLTFLLSRIVLFVIVRIANFTTKLPIIRQFNKLGGGLLGLLEGGAVIYLVLSLIFLIAPIRDSEIFREQMRGSVITQKMYTENLIMKMAAPSGAATTEEGADL